MPVCAVIFDLMDVLLCLEGRSMWREWEASVGVAESGLVRTMFQSPQFKEAISGHVSEAALWRDVAQTLGVEVEPSRLAAVFYSAFRVNSGLVECIRALRPRFKTAILTNTPSDMRVVVTQQFHLDREVDTIIMSSEEGMMKPQPEIFQLALTRLGVQPSETLFVDDEPRYVEAARALGMWAVQFNDNAQARREIEQVLHQGLERPDGRASGILPGAQG
jgi:putative hydrolase of the HAD superfamily